MAGLPVLTACHVQFRYGHNSLATPACSQTIFLDINTALTDQATLNTLADQLLNACVGWAPFAHSRAIGKDLAKEYYFSSYLPGVRKPHRVAIYSRIYFNVPWSTLGDLRDTTSPTNLFFICVPIVEVVHIGTFIPASTLNTLNTLNPVNTAVTYAINAVKTPADISSDNNSGYFETDTRTSTKANGNKDSNTEVKHSGAEIEDGDMEVSGSKVDNTNLITGHLYKAAGSKHGDVEMEIDTGAEDDSSDSGISDRESNVSALAEATSTTRFSISNNVQKVARDEAKEDDDKDDDDKGDTKDDDDKDDSDEDDIIGDRP